MPPMARKRGRRHEVARREPTTMPDQPVTPPDGLLTLDEACELRRIAAFDFLTNNAGRKGAHFLLGRQDGQIWGIDHGLCFNAAPKLRTVIWESCGEPIPAPLLQDIRALRADVPRLKALFDQL